MEVGHVPVRHSTRLCNRQLQAIRLRFLPTMLRGTAYPELLFYADASPSKQTS
jgi:hypothetical protein